MGRGGYGLPEDACWDIALCLRLAPPVSTMDMENMVMEVRFDSLDYIYMNEGTSALLFVKHTDAAAERL